MADEKKTVQGQWWYFVFGEGKKHEGHYVRIFGTPIGAREEMNARYGSEWSFQYRQKYWESLEAARDQLPYELETELIED